MLRVLPIALFVALLASPADAAPLLVPEDYELQEAVDAAEPGDIVSVGPGTYDDRIRHNVPTGSGIVLSFQSVLRLRPGVTVLARNGPEGTTLQGVAVSGFGEKTTVLGTHAGSDGAVLDGFTITAEAGDLRCFALYQSDGIEIRGCRMISNNTEPGLIGVVEWSTDIELQDCEITSSQGEIFLKHSSVAFTDSSILGTTLSSDSYRLVRLSGCSLRDFEGIAIHADNFLPGYFGEVMVEDCTFRGGSIGVAVTFRTKPRIRGCMFDGQILSAISLSQINDSVIEGNTVVNYHRVALEARRSRDIELRNNVFAGGRGTEPAIYERDSNLPNTVVASCNLYWDNEGGNVSEASYYGATDLIDVDPQFCDAAAGDYTLTEDSPAIAGTCGQIGAFGIGCGTVSLNATSWSRVKALYRDAESPPPSGR